MKKFFKSMQENEDGVVALMFALILPVLLFFLALSIDLSRTFATRAKLVSAQDAAILAAAITPPEYRYKYFSSCGTCSSGGTPDVATAVEEAEYGYKYLELNLGNSYLGTDVTADDKVVLTERGGSIGANSRDVQVKPFFLPDSNLTGGTDAEVAVAGKTVITPVLIGFVVDVSGSIRGSISGGTTKIDALESALTGYLNAIAVTDSGGYKVLPEGYKIAFADFDRDSGYRIAVSSLIAKNGNNDDPNSADNSVLQGDEQQSDSDVQHFYDTDTILTINNTPSTGNPHYNKYHVVIPDTMNFTDNYNEITTFVNGDSLHPGIRCQTPLLQADINCRYDGGNVPLYFKVAKQHAYNSKIFKGVHIVNDGGGSCGSCGLYKISDFFTQTEDDNNANYEPYGLPCTSTGCYKHNVGMVYPPSPSKPYYQRIIVLMSDGGFLNFNDRKQCDGGGGPGCVLSAMRTKDIYGSQIYRDPAQGDRDYGLSERTVFDTCDVLRAKGYKIIAVDFGTTQSDNMKRCATGDKNNTTASIYNPLTGRSSDETVYFNANTASKLETVFKDLAKATVATSELRLTK